MALLKSYSTPGRLRQGALASTPDQDMAGVIDGAMPGARFGRADPLAGLMGPGSFRHDAEMAMAKPEAQLRHAADALWGRVRSQVGQSGVDLGEHARLRQAAVHAGNLAGGRPQGYASDDPHSVSPYQIQRAFKALVEQR